MISQRVTVMLVCALSAWGLTKTPPDAAGSSQQRTAYPTQVPHRADQCLDSAGASPLVTPHAIGPLDLTLPITALRLLCPSARDTTWDGEETVNPSIVFHLGTVTVMASQHVGRHDGSLTPTLPADFWRVIGSAARMGPTLTLASTWHDLHASLGRMVIAENDDFGLALEVCRSPHIWLFAHPAPPGESFAPDDLSFIPDSTKVQEIWVLTWPVKTHWGTSQHRVVCDEGGRG